MIEHPRPDRLGRTRRKEIARRRALGLTVAALLVVGVIGYSVAFGREGGARPAATVTHPRSMTVAATSPATTTTASATSSTSTLAPASGALTAGARTDGPAPARATVTYRPGGRTIALPRSFFGFSVEVWDTLHDARYLSLFKRAFELVRVPGDGPQILRVGGNSTDQSYWHAPLPSGHPFAYELGRRWLAATSRLARALKLKVILGLNAVARAPEMASSLAAAVLGAMPRHSVIGFEIGNEPDLYWYRFRVQFAAMSRSARGLAAQNEIFTPTGYADTFATYAEALRRVAPRVPLVGPAVSNPLRGYGWLSTLIAHDRRSVGLLTAHRYPLSACVHERSSPLYPSVGALLSQRASAGMAESVVPAVRLAHRDGLKLRLTEFNSVTCLGVPGVSNAFATALWAPDALFEMLHAGIDGINLHLRVDSWNAPFVLGPAGFDAQPEMYGVIAFIRTLGPGARLAPVHLRGDRGGNLKVWAVRLRGHWLRLLVIDKSVRPADLTLRLEGAHGSAGVERLLASSPWAEHGVTLAGQSLNRQGQWVGRRVVEHLRPAHGGYRLNVRGFTAALVSAALRG